MLKTFQTGFLNVGRQAFKLKERTLEQLAWKNYYTARAYYHYKLRRSDNRYHKKPPLIVHQMGKVGSSSVTRSLRAAKIDRHIYHTHFLRPALIDKFEKQRRNHLGTGREGGLKHIWQYQHLSKQLKRGLKGRRWKIITLVRDPIARNLSDFFEHLELLPVAPGQPLKVRSEAHNYELTIDNNNLEGLVELFFDRYDHDTPLTFFDQEFKGVFKIDLFASDFPTSKGYQVYREKEVDLLLIRLENLNTCFSEAVKAFLNIDNLPLIQANTSAKKDFATLYQMFKDTIHFPESYLEKMYSSRFARHFYSDLERAQFKVKWSGNSRTGIKTLFVKDIM